VYFPLRRSLDRTHRRIKDAPTPPGKGGRRNDPSIRSQGIQSTGEHSCTTSQEPRTTWRTSGPLVLWIRAILRGHTQNTNGKDVRLRAQAHSKGCRGSAYEGHPSTRGDRTAGQGSPLQSDSEPRRADTYSTAPSPSRITRVEAKEPARDHRSPGR
jgi:hypothetical protein